MSDQRPIGIFDSGVGGLTVLKAIRERLPLEPTIYVADLLHFPYGPRYQEEVRGFALDIVRYLESREVKLVVIACNTATAAALNPAIARVYPGSFEMIDSATTTAAKVERHLEHSRLRADGAEPRHEVLVTAVPQRFDAIAAHLFGEAIEAEEVTIWQEQRT